MQSAEYLFWIGFVAAGVGILFSLLQIWRTVSLPRENGDPSIPTALQKSLHAYCLRQYGAGAVAVALLFALLLGGCYLGLLDNWNLPFAFLSGALLPAITGLVGLYLSAVAGRRAALAVEHSLELPLTASISAGTVTGFLGTGLALLELTGWFYGLRYGAGYDALQIARTMLPFVLGAALFSLFSRVGSGIFSAGADLAAGAASKGSVTIPADHFHNPASMAHLTGSLANGVSGLTHELYSAFSMALLAAFALGAPAFDADGLSWSAMLLPLAVASAGLLCSLISVFLIRVREDRPLIKAIRPALFTAALLTAAISAPLSFALMGSWLLCLPVALGVLAGAMIPIYLQWAASAAHRPVQRLSAPAETDPGSSLLNGLSLGMRTLILPILCLAVALPVAFWACGGSLNTAGTTYWISFAKGAYGVALFAVGALSATPLFISVGAGGSVAQNTLRLVLLGDRDESCRNRALQLFELGSAALDTAKGLAAAGTLTALLPLLMVFPSLFFLEADLISPHLLSGLLLGAILAFLFTSLILSGVQRSSRAASKEIRQQFRVTKGILSGKTPPDHGKCTALCANATLWVTLPPFLLALAAPLLAGLLLGPKGAVGLLLGVIAAGAPLSLFLSGAGGIWNSVRRFLSEDPHADEESDRLKAATLCDAVGLPLRSAAGPALISLIRFSAALTAATAGLIASWNLVSFL